MYVKTILAVVAAPPSRGYRVRKFVRRNKGVVMAGSAVAATLLLGIAGTTIGLGIAQHNANVAYTNAEIAQTARDELSKANTTLVEQTDEAEWSSYTANLALAQMAMDNGNWPEARDRIAACPESKRGWEWEFADRSSRGIITLRGHAERVYSAVFSPDGSTVLTASQDHTSRLWDAQTGAILSILPVPVLGDFSDSYLTAKFSPDGATVLLFRGDTLYLLDPVEATLTILDLTGRDELLSLRVAAVLGRPLGQATLETTTPDGSRRIVAAPDQTLQFFTVPDGPNPDPDAEAAAAPRMVASSAMPAAITDLQMTDDGTRLVVMLADGSARVLDIRDRSEQRKDYERARAEREPAGAYLASLMAGPTPTDELLAIIKADDSLTPLRRLAAAEVLDERLADIEYQADRAFEAITKDQTDKAQVLAAAEAADLPVRVKEQVLAKAREWKP